LKHENRFGFGHVNALGNVDICFENGGLLLQQKGKINLLFHVAMSEGNMSTIMGMIVRLVMKMTVRPH
jgi:hypothetical protein